MSFRHSVRHIASFDVLVWSWYTWLDNDSLLVLKPGNDPSDATGYETRAFIYNIHFKNWRLVKDNWARVQPDNRSGDIDSLEDKIVVAPDRKNFLLVGRYGPQVLPIFSPVSRYRTFQSDPHQDQFWQTAVPETEAWQPDDAAWSTQGDYWLAAATTRTHQILYYYGNRSGSITKSGLIAIPNPLNGKIFTEWSVKILGIYSDGSVAMIVHPSNPGIEPDSVFTLLEFHPGGQTPRFTNVVMPTDFDPANFEACALSPHSHQIAWLLPYHHNLSKAEIIEARISNVLGMHEHAPDADTAIWVSDAHGRNMRIAGIWYRGLAQDSNLQWSPDESTISFNQSLYISDLIQRTPPDSYHEDIMAVTP